MNDILKHTLDGFDLMFSATQDGRKTAEYKRLQALDTLCWMCGKHDCGCCTTCMDLGEVCGTCWANEDDTDDIDDGYRENESQADYEARSFGVPRQGPI